MGRPLAAAAAAAALALAGRAGPLSGGPPAPAALELVATGVPRPLQLALDGRRLVVLSPGLRGDAAGELYHVDLAGPLPLDLARQPRVRVPFADGRMATLGSLAVDPGSRQLFLGEENGTRIYRLGADGRLAVYATGLHRLPGGSSLAFDGRGRLLVIDHADPTLSAGEERAPPGLEQLRDEEYTGPLVYRLALEADIPLPRRLDRLVPLFPRGSRTRALPLRMISLAAFGSGELAVLASTGELFRLTEGGALARLTRLATGHGQYNRTNMVPGPDGGLLVSGGFQVARVFRVSADGEVEILAENLGDPEGLALDDQGWLYVAESALHRIVRLKLR